VPNGDSTYTALLGDPRNDENLMIAGLHCAHILFYNGCWTSCLSSIWAGSRRPARGSGQTRMWRS
jgi:hypothetical protein